MRAGGFAFAADRARFVLGRIVIKRVLGAILARPGPALALTVTDAGKPILAAGPAGLDFSLSHAGDLVALAVGWRPLGLDIEAGGRSLAPGILAPFLAPGERVAPGDDLNLWTAKEALGKALGLGLGADLAQYPMRPAGTGPGAWSIYPLTAPGAFSAHLAVAGSAPIDLQFATFDAADDRVGPPVAMAAIPRWRAGPGISPGR